MSSRHWLKNLQIEILSWKYKILTNVIVVLVNILHYLNLITMFSLSFMLICFKRFKLVQNVTHVE